MQLQLTEKEFHALEVLLFSYENNRQTAKDEKGTFVKMGEGNFLPETDRALRRLNKKINEDLYK